ncbi:MAG: hypothetical protein JSS10_05110 [Verrucomicrobia bacterium]|nr:hypothetical protein [Verrucomicrobiota bacterium]
MVITTVTYRYGSETGPDNRQVQFIRTSSDTLEARFSVLTNGQLLSQLREDHISVEMTSSTDKTRRLAATRAGHSPPQEAAFSLGCQHCLISTFPTPLQDQFIKSINPHSSAKGGRWIEIKAIPGINLEIVVDLVITDPR